MDFYQHFTNEEQAILQERANRVKLATQSEELADMLVVLTISIKKELYGLPVDSLLGTYENVKITKLPGAPEHIAGVINLRGHLITVLDLGSVLGISRVVQSKRNALIVTTNGTNQVGLLVEQVSEVQRILSSEIQISSSTQQSQHTEYLTGVMANGTAIIDVRAIIDAPRLIVDQGIS